MTPDFLSASVLLVLCWLAAPSCQAMPGFHPPPPKRGSAGANENSPVLVREGLVLHPNSSADSAGCIAFYNKMPTGRLLSEAVQQPSIGDCCRACKDTPPCNAFVYCPREAGCATGSSFSNVAQLPYLGCALLYQGLSDPATGRPTLAIPAPGFAGGAPITVIDSPELPGYQRLPGRGFFNRFDFICEGSAAASSCMLWGRAQLLAPRCDADPRCRIMIDLPHGWDYLGGAMTSLKGGPGCTLAGNTSEGALNPNAAVYIKLSPPSLDLETMLEVAMGAAVGAAGVLFSCLAAKRWWKQRPGAPAPAASSPSQGTSVKELPEELPAVKPMANPHDSAKEDIVPLAGQHGAGSSGSEGRTVAWVQFAAAAEVPHGAGTGEKMRVQRTYSSGPAGYPIEQWLNLPSFSVPSRISSIAGPASSGELGSVAEGEQLLEATSAGSGSVRQSIAVARAVAPGSTPAQALAPSPSMLPSPFRASSDAGFEESPSPFAETPWTGADSGSGGADPRSGPGWSGGGGGDGAGQARGGIASEGALQAPDVSHGGPPRRRASWGPNLSGPSRLPEVQSTRDGPVSGASAISGSASVRSTGSTIPGSSQLLSRLPEQHWEDWVVDFEAIEFCTTPDGNYQSLGSGGFGTVYRVMLDGVQPYAAKVLSLGPEEGELETVFLREASLLQRLRHGNIVGFRGVSISEGRGVIIMELMEGGDLFSRLGTRNKTTWERLFGWHNRGKRVALDVARGIHYLHSLSLTHFDIKANNILLTRDLTAKIADVGFTRAMATTHHSIKDSRIGTFAYMAPELLLGSRVTNSVDIFSFGVLLWEICSGEHPSRGQLRPLRIPEEAPQEVADLCEECMAADPDARPSARQLVERVVKLVAQHTPGTPADRR